MKNNYTHILSVAFFTLLFAGGATAQQLPQFSQYMQNAYVLNPAASSLHTDVDLNVGFRQQWSGFEGAPQTYYASGTVNLGKKPTSSGYLYSIPISNPRMLTTTDTERYAKHVVGGLAAVDEYGLFKRTSVMGSYSYHHPVADDYYIAVGASMGWYGLNFGANEVRLENPSDNTYNDFIANGTRSNIFDINAGLYIYSDRAFLGYSVYQIGRNQINLGNESTPINLSEARLELHQYATVGYRFSAGENFDLTPSLMFKFLNPAPTSFDINLKAEFMRKFWLGVSYRNEDAVSLLAGLHINETIRFGYAYDYVTSQINNISSGSHELVLGFQFNRKN